MAHRKIHDDRFRIHRWRYNSLGTLRTPQRGMNVRFKRTNRRENAFRVDHKSLSMACRINPQRMLSTLGPDRACMGVLAWTNWLPKVFCKFLRMSDSKSYIVIIESDSVVVDGGCDCACMLTFSIWIVVSLRFSMMIWTCLNLIRSNTSYSSCGNTESVQPIELKPNSKDKAFLSYLKF